MLGGVAVVAYCALLLAATAAAAGTQQFQDLHNAIEKKRRLQTIKQYIRQQVPGFRIPVTAETAKPSKPKDEPISIVLGEPASPKKDGCLSFPIGSKLSQKGNVKPVKMELYVHVKLVTKKNRKSRNTDKTEKKKRKKKSKKRNRKSNKRRRKPKKKRKGKKIEVIVTNGVERLAKLRRRVYETYWFGIELPITQFNEISHQDSFKLCITCKRCKKKVILDLYKEDHQQIPFIEIKTEKINLPRRRPRSTRSSGALQNGVQLIPSRNSSSSALSQCCVEEVLTEDINIPSLLHPSTFAMSFCETVHNTDSVSSSNTFNKLLSKDNTGNIQSKCVPASYESFTYSFLDRDLRIKYAAIPDLLPSGCKCVRS